MPRRPTAATDMLPLPAALMRPPRRRHPRRRPPPLRTTVPKSKFIPAPTSTPSHRVAAVVRAAPCLCCGSCGRPFSPAGRTITKRTFRDRTGNDSSTGCKAVTRSNWKRSRRNAIGRKNRWWPNRCSGPWNRPNNGIGRRSTNSAGPNGNRKNARRNGKFRCKRNSGRINSCNASFKNCRVKVVGVGMAPTWWPCNGGFRNNPKNGSCNATDRDRTASNSKCGFPTKTIPGTLSSNWPPSNSCPTRRTCFCNKWNKGCSCKPRYPFITMVRT
mmetsp:Transcript_11522/g.25749  ORF Transcript_11522/g.25749 Transcript_11522/m.25749 type:complete len:272 (+) Transcript_11522:556-1371(+)